MRGKLQASSEAQTAEPVSPVVVPDTPQVEGKQGRALLLHRLLPTAQQATTTDSYIADLMLRITEGAPVYSKGIVSWPYANLRVCLFRLHLPPLSCLQTSSSIHACNILQASIGCPNCGTPAIPALYQMPKPHLLYTTPGLNRLLPYAGVSGPLAWIRDRFASLVNRSNRPNIPNPQRTPQSGQHSPRSHHDRPTSHTPGNSEDSWQPPVRNSRRAAAQHGSSIHRSLTPRASKTQDVDAPAATLARKRR